MNRGIVGEAAHNLRHGGPSVVLEALSRAYLTHWRRTDGDHVFDREWDLLVVLDACRADLMEAVVDDYDWLTMAGTIDSVGATSTEWFERTFDPLRPETLARTGYVTGNPYSATHVDREAFAFVEEVWRDGWDDDRGLIPARPITDRAVAVGRDTGRACDRLIVHYMQPHFPCVPRAGSGAGIALDRFGEESISVWEELRFGRQTREEVWDASIENLRYVLDDVALLVENVDADRVAITADHGNAMGEGYLHGHAAGVSLPALREVPWCVTTASDEGGHAPDEAADVEPNEDDDPDAADVESRLEALGYR